MPESKVTLILGKRGSGKSYRAKQKLKLHNNVFIYDTMGEYNNDGIIFKDSQSLEQYWTKHTDKFKIVFQPLQPTQEFDYISSLVYSVGNLCYLVEELDTFCSPYSFSDDFANIVQRGRHRNIEFIGVSQRPYGINRTLSSQAKEIISFKMTEPRDIDFLSLYMGEDVQRVRELEQYQYLRWTDDGTEIINSKGEVANESKIEEPEN